MALPFARFSQLLEVTARKKQDDRKFLFQQAVFISWWIYTSIPKGEDAEHYTMSEWLDMYGLLSEVDKVTSKEEKQSRHKEEIEKAYRNYSKITNMLST